MEKKIINPWQWQNERHYVQAVEVTKFQGILYCSGQAAIFPDGSSSSADMKTQFLMAIENLEKVILEAGYETKNIARLTIYTTAHDEFFANLDILGQWVDKNGIQAAVSAIEVKSLTETLKIELEATVVK
ncbi:RidA family protein [Pedobacter lithocola]|uniref:RidA family protein n=1 Tax=Pedobacter lithocola TaxID=1908239 RepID=A0ABV8P7T6_9SPHI